jgi:hypothetical protein
MVRGTGLRFGDAFSERDSGASERDGNRSPEPAQRGLHFTAAMMGV